MKSIIMTFLVCTNHAFKWTRFLINNYSLKANKFVTEDIHEEYVLNRVDGALQIEFKNLLQYEKPFKIDYADHIKRLKYLKNELVSKSIGKADLVVDLTAGLGRDSVIIACSGNKVCMFERNEILYQLLSDGINRFLRYGNSRHDISVYNIDSCDTPQILDIIKTKLINLQSTTTFDSDPSYSPITNFTPHTLTSPITPSINASMSTITNQPNITVYLDPMYPSGLVGKSALVKKETQILHRLLGHTEGNNDKNNYHLFYSAFHIATSRIVVKRPLHSEPLLHIKPHESIQGSKQRFDIYFKNRPIHIPEPPT